MNLNQRQLKIISMLLSEKRFVSSNELAKIFYVTDRTVKNDYKIIKSFFDQENIQYELKSRKGIKVISDNIEEISSSFLKEYNYGNYRTEYQQRAFILLRRIVNKTEWFSIETLASEMNFSRSIISDLLPEIRYRLSRYNLTLEKRTHYGMKIHGKEMNIRCAIIDTFDIAESDISSEHYIDELKETNLYSFVKIKNVLHELFLQYEIESQEILIDKIVLAIVVSLIRSKHGALIEESFSEIQDSKMKQIITTLSDTLGLNMSELDVSFVSIYALNFTFPKKRENYSEYYVSLLPEANQLFEKIIQYVKDNFNYDVQHSVILTELQKFSLHYVISNKYRINAIFFSREISRWSSNIPGIIDCVYRIFEDLDINHGYECSRYLLYYAALIFEIALSLKKKAKFYKEIVIVSNFNTIVGLKYFMEVNKHFKDIIPIRMGVYEGDENVLYVIIDDKKIIGKNIIHAVYDMNKNYLFEIIESHISNRILDDISFEYEEINYTENVSDIQELFTIVAQCFNESPNNVKSTINYLVRRHSARSIDYGNVKYIFLILFDQEKKGFKRIVFNNLINIRNRFINEIFVFSIDKSNVEEYMKVLKMQENLLNNK